LSALAEAERAQARRPRLIVIGSVIYMALIFGVMLWRGISIEPEWVVLALLVIAVELVGIGFWPAFIALVALGIPPIVTNSYVGMREVDADVREAARGMGMRARAVLWQVELPIAVPLIMAGVRTSAVNIVATATLAALVAYGGLGRFIVDGLAQRDFVQLFAGALLVAVLSVAVELGLTGLQRLTTPIGLRSETRTREVPSTRLSTA